MNYWNGQQWVASDPSFDLTTNAFVATRVQAQVRLSAQLNRIGAVSVNTRDGKALLATPVGIALYNPVSGLFKVIAGLTNSTGVLVASNQVLYPGAFSGGICADLVYTLKKGSFEQDVVLTGQFDPTDFGFPTNSRLQVLTEFYQAPQPDRVRHPLYVEKNELVRQQMVSPDVMDETLGFGEFVLGTGWAFTTPSAAHTNGTQTAVGKEFLTLQGRTFLVETVGYQNIKAGLAGLPPCAGGKTARIQQGGERNGYAFIPRPASLAQADAKPQKISGLQLVYAPSGPRSGAVIDFVATIGGTMNDPFVFRGDTTYDVTGAYVCNGPVVIDGGVVIKYSPGGSITLNNTLACKTSSYRPSVFTSVNDDTVGTTLSGYPGYTGQIEGWEGGSGAYPYLRTTAGGMGFSNLRFRYAEDAIRIEGQDCYSTIAHCQFINCLRGITLVGDYGSGSGSGSGGGQNLHVYNTLLDQVGTVLTTINLTGSGSGNSAPVWFQSCTVDHNTTLFVNDGPMDNYFQNCILANINDLGSGARQGGYNAFFNTQTFGDNSLTLYTSPFVSPGIGGGNHYLTPDTPCRNAGWEYDPELAKRTTSPPLLSSGPVASDATWVIQAERDTGQLDAGYHYDPIDYLVNNVSLSASLTLAQGVVVGVQDGNTGFVLQAGANLYSIGAPLTFNGICSARSVQEYSAISYSFAQYLQIQGSTSGAGSGTRQFRFTDFAMPPGESDSSIAVLSSGQNISGELSFRDCRLRGGKLNISPTTFGSALNVSLNNNLVEYANVNVAKAAATPMTLDLYNNLFRNDSMQFIYGLSVNPTWHIQDNLFDGAPQAFYGAASYTVVSCNGFITGTANALGGSNNKEGLTPDYQAGPLGDYYYPSSGSFPSLASLINAGSRDAMAAGLYHFTVKTSAYSKEGADTPATVDIGYHYVGVNGDIYSQNPLPLDSDNDGILDYLDPDSDGDGLNDSDEIVLGTNPLQPNVWPLSFSPVGGDYASAQNVAITCPTPGVTIHYTLDGQEPTESSSIYFAPVPIGEDATLKARAWKAGWVPNDTETQSYRINPVQPNEPPTISISPPTGTAFLASEDIEFLVEAADADGTVSKIQLFRDGFKVAEANGSPLRYTFSKVISGSYTFTAKVMDNLGAVTLSAPVLITVNASGPEVSLYGTQPLFTASPGTLEATVVGVNPASPVSLTLNGSPIQAFTGSSQLPVYLAEGANTFTLVATAGQNQSAQATTTVYLDSSAPVVAITAPADNTSFDTSRINVSGTFTETNLKQITVNGVLAFISGNAFEALNVPLAEGANTVTATAEDISGNQSTADITVTGGATPVDPVQLAATPVGGFVSLQVTFTPTANVPGTLQQVLYDFNGDGVTDQTETDLNPINHTYTTAGEYFPVVTIQTSAGRFSSLGGWIAWNPDRLRINVQEAPVQESVISITDPVDLKTTDDGHLYVLSRSTATITEYDASHAVVRALASIGTTPTGLDVDAEGNVYVALSGDHQVAKFNPTTAAFQLDTAFGSGGVIGKTDKTSGTGDGEFNTPYDVAVSPDGEEIAISDSSNHRIQRFTSVGVFIATFGQQGSDVGEFNTPKGLAYDGGGYLYIVDSGNDRIVLTLSSVVVGTSGSEGMALGQYQGPLNLGVGSRGIYIADTGNNRMQAFEPIKTGDGAEPTPFGMRLEISSQFGLSQPNAVAPITDFLAERIYIADTANNRVIKATLPETNPPDAVWNAMTDRLINHQDIPGAIAYFSKSSADKYRDAFLAIGVTALAQDVSPAQTGPIIPVFIDADIAEYRFNQILGGYTILFTIDFVKENGEWKIETF
jgi:hypothetical protein